MNILCEFGEQQFILGAKQEDGGTLRDHLETGSRQSGIVPELLVPVPCPYEVKYIWEWYQELSFRRHYGQAGPLPLTHREIKAWKELMNIRDLEKWEINALKALDSVQLKVLSDDYKKTRAANKKTASGPGKARIKG